MAPSHLRGFVQSWVYRKKIGIQINQIWGILGWWADWQVRNLTKFTGLTLKFGWTWKTTFFLRLSKFKRSLDILSIPLKESEVFGMGYEISPFTCDSLSLSCPFLLVIWAKGLSILSPQRTSSLVHWFLYCFLWFCFINFCFDFFLLIRLAFYWVWV